MIGGVEQVGVQVSLCVFSHGSQSGVREWCIYLCVHTHTYTHTQKERRVRKRLIYFKELACVNVGPGKSEICSAV